jgi:uncharacterized protein
VKTVIPSNQDGGPNVSSKDQIICLLNTNSEELRSRFGVRRIGLFGSYATGNARKRSDVDIVVAFDHHTYRAYYELTVYLEAMFGRKVDLVIERSIKPAIREHVLGQTIYAEAVDSVPAGHSPGN